MMVLFKADVLASHCRKKHVSNYQHEGWLHSLQMSQFLGPAIVHAGSLAWLTEALK